MNQNRVITISGLLIALFASFLTISSQAQQSQPVLVSKWEPVGLGLEDASVRCAVFDAQGNLYASLANYSTKSVFVLPSGSKTWRGFAEGLPVRGNVQLFSTEKKELIATVNKNPFILHSGKLTWEEYAQGGYAFLSAGDILISAMGSDYIYFNFHDSQRKGSINFSANSPGLSIANYLPPMLVDSEGHLLVAAISEIYRSDQKLVDAYTKVSNGYQLGGSLSGVATSLEADDSAIYVSVVPDGSRLNGNGVFKLSAIKNTWSDITSNLPKSSFYKLKFDRIGNLFASTAENGVFVLPIGLTTWLPVAASSLTGDSKTVYDMTFDPNGALIIATKAGIFRGTRSQ